jgi:hypothetical protein
MDALSAAEINCLGLNWKDNESLAGLGTGKAPGMTGNINGLTRRMSNVLCTVLHTNILKPEQTFLIFHKWIASYRKAG